MTPLQRHVVCLANHSAASNGVPSLASAACIGSQLIGPITCRITRMRAQMPGEL